MRLIGVTILLTIAFGVLTSMGWGFWDRLGLWTAVCCMVLASHIIWDQ